jgi:hypothetical protein
VDVRSLPGWERRELRALWVTLLVLAAVAIGVAITLPTGRSASRRSASASPGGRSSSDPDAAVLRQLVVGQGDIGAGRSIALLPGGNAVRGEVTLDLCNGSFPSESARTARLQDVEVDDQGQSSLSTEAVLYKSPAATSQAFRELHDVAAHCPSKPVAGPNGGPSIKTQIAGSPDKSWPRTSSVDRLAYEVVQSDNQGQTQHTIVVYLRRGRALLGVYFPQSTGPQPPVAGKTTVQDVVNLFESRLASLPANVVNRMVASVALS